MKLITRNINNEIPVFFLLFSLFIFSCQSTEEKTDHAFEDAKLSKEFTDDSLDMETEAELVPLLATKPMKVVVVDSWINYSKEIEKEIKANESRIAELRTSSSSNVKTFKRIASLESINLNLNKRMIDYDMEAKADLERFKSKLKADMLVLNADINQLSISIKSK
jgi:hypothetical protein